MENLEISSGSDHSTQMLSGGALSVENVNVVNNRGRFSTNLNASTSTFDVNLLDTFLKYPTVMYDGTISSTMPIGTTIYQTLVSPALLNSTSLSRVTNFSTNFRQWTGAMAARMIFTKPIFVQTKVIAAFIPGATIESSPNITIPDMYGAQYHVVMNPDNDNELEFKIPFISGVNWLDMEHSTGLFIVKLFQPLIASQPTGVVNVSIPFTITISSNVNRNTDGEKLMPLNFRYLVAPSYQNQTLLADFREVLVNSISPQIKDQETNKYAGYIPVVQTDQYVAKSLVFLPKDKINTFINQKFGNIANYDKGFDSTPNSLDSSRDLIFTNSNIPIRPPFCDAYLTGKTYTKVIIPYASISVASIIPIGNYTFDQNSTLNRFLFCSNKLVCAVGTYTGSPLTLTGVLASTIRMFSLNVVVTVARSTNGGYNYFIQTNETVGIFDPTVDSIDFTKPINVEMYKTSMTPIQYLAEIAEMKTIVSSDRGGANPDYTHFAVVSTSGVADAQYETENGNYSNCVVASQDQMAASFADRALTTSELISDDSGFGERVDFITLLMLVKVGVDVVAKASRILSDVLTYVIPIFQANGSYISPNQIVAIDLVGSVPTYYEVDKTRSAIDSYPDITNSQVIIYNDV